MDDVKVILYIIAGVVYVLYRLFKNSGSKQPQGPSEQPNNNPGAPSPKRANKDTQRPVTFEELLKEFAGAEEQSTETADTRTQEMEAYESRDRVEEGSVEIEEAPYDEEAVYVDEEETSQEYIDWERRMAETEHSLLDARQRTKKSDFGKWGVEEEEPAFDLDDLLDDPEDLKKGIIYAEIFNRKY